VDTLIIGFGKRAKYSILPALKIINEGKLYVFSNNLNKLETQKKKYDFELFNSIENESYEKISKIFICTPYEKYLPIVQRLSKLNLTWVNLFIDTPIIPKISNIHIKQYKNKFKEIFVTEDCFYNPINNIIQEVIKINKLGEIKKIDFNNFGHTYHALAQSRRLLKDKSIYFGIKNNDNFKFILSNSVININGKQLETGHIHIFFKENIISINDDNINNNAKYKISYLFTEDLFSGYLVNNQTVSLDDNLKKIFLKLRQICTIHNIRNKFLQEKIISLVCLMTEINNQNKKKYFLDDGIYDSFLIAITRKINFFFDIRFKKKSLFIYIFYKFYNFKKIFSKYQINLFFK
tara:strand:- start:1214 stop:2260 length:1047 start_codon:yes stop_codon:yes gene_type:complete